MNLGNYAHCTMAKALFGLLFTCFFLEAMTSPFKEEEPCSLDVAVLIDVSQSMDESERGDLNTIFNSIVDELRVSPDGSHMAIITFGWDAKLIFTFSDNKYHNAVALKEKAKEAIFFEPAKEGTRTDLAEELAVKEVFTPNGGDRDKFRNVMIIFTDGKFWINPQWDTKPKVDFDVTTKTLETKGVKVIVAGIGSEIKSQRDTDANLRMVAGKDGAILKYADFGELSRKLNDLMKKVCALDCPPGWRAFDSSCYKIMTNFLISTKLSWGDARSVCLGFGGDLVSIVNKKEMDFVDEISSGIGSELIWIGLSDSLGDGEFAWSDGAPFNGSVYNNWGRRQPTGGEYCVAHSISERRWHDYPCSYTFDYLCEKPKDITCYHCTSNVSFAGCARKQTEVTCTLPRSRCVKVEYSSNGNHQTFYKGCATTKDCEATSDKSFVDCCDDNFCNKESELSCFKCSSTVSHDECQKRRQEHVCRSSKDDRCYYASMQQTSQDGSSVTKHFEYGCTNNLHCNDTGNFFAGCDEPSNACQVRCCGKNLCNEVAATQEEEPFKVNSTIAYASMATVAGLVLLCFITGFCFYRKSRRKQMERSARNGLEIIALDKWEILPEEIEYEEELGRGAFGVVYKATLKKRQGIEIFDPVEKVQQNNTIQMVAVKELQVDSSEEQVLDFLNEISQMKLLAAHPNIVSLVGCSTLCKHKFLVLEYVPYGDLLEWLRKKRKSINQYLATEEKQAEKFYEESEPQSNQCQQGKIKPSQLVSTETTEQGKVEENDFSTRQLLSFAAQVARGMVS